MTSDFGSDYLGSNPSLEAMRLEDDLFIIAQSHSSELGYENRRFGERSRGDKIVFT